MLPKYASHLSYPFSRRSKKLLTWKNPQPQPTPCGDGGGGSGNDSNGGEGGRPRGPGNDDQGRQILPRDGNPQGNGQPLVRVFYGDYGFIHVTLPAIHSNVTFPHNIGVNICKPHFINGSKCFLRDYSAADRIILNNFIKVIVIPLFVAFSTPSRLSFFSFFLFSISLTTNL